MVLLDSYFTLNKEQREKFLTKEERKELKQAKKERKLAAEQEGEEEEIEIEETQQKKEKKSKKNSKKQQEEEVVEEEEVVAEQKPKKSKKSKKEKKEQVQQEQQQQDSDVEEKIVKKVKKEKKIQKADSEASTEGEQVGESQREKSLKLNAKIFGDITDQAGADQWRKEHELTISGQQGNEDKDPKFYPFTTFKNTSLSESVLHFTEKFSKPSPIQAAAWPILLQNRDCVAIAETGSGKTLGFLLPAFQHILDTTKDIKSAKNPRVIIVSPTRELATQIQEVCEEAQRQCGIKSVCLYGGVAKHEQKQMLRSGVQVVIGTPGRMKDLMQEGAINMKEVSMVVLDEGDRLLDMGFAPDIKYIFGQVKSDRQGVMFSATWPKEVQEVANSYIKNPVMIKIGTEEGTANKRVTQTVEVIKSFARNNRLEELLRKYTINNEKIIVFVLYKQEASRMEQFIAQKGYKVVALHGDMSQKARNDSFKQFKEGSVKILVATDVAARGLDIPNVEHVINYSFPLTCSDYVHRIGRTGRAGKLGNSYTFFQPDCDKKLAGDLCQILKEAGQKVNPDLEKFGPTIHKKATHSMYGDHFKEVDMTKTAVKTKL